MLCHSRRPCPAGPTMAALMVRRSPDHDRRQGGGQSWCAADAAALLHLFFVASVSPAPATARSQQPPLETRRLLQIQRCLRVQDFGVDAAR